MGNQSLSKTPALIILCLRALVVGVGKTLLFAVALSTISSAMLRSNSSSPLWLTLISFGRFLGGACRWIGATRNLVRGLPVRHVWPSCHRIGVKHKRRKRLCRSALCWFLLRMCVGCRLNTRWTNSGYSCQSSLSPLACVCFYFYFSFLF